MTKNLRLWIMLAAIPILLSIIIASYEKYVFSNQIYYYATDSEDILENEKDFIRRSHYKIDNVEKSELFLNLANNIDIRKSQTPEYINTESELLKTQNNYSFDSENTIDALAPSDDMLEMDENGNPVFYVVKEGEWLALIAETLYGDKLCWRYIYEVNRDMLLSPDNVKPGMKLYLPNIDYFKINAIGVKKENTTN